MIRSVSSHVAAGGEAFGGLLGAAFGEDLHRVVVDGDCSPRAFVLGVAPRCALVGGTNDSSILSVLFFGVEVVPLEGQQLAAAEPVEDVDPKRDGPAVVSCRGEEAVDLERTSTSSPPSPYGLGHGARKADKRRRRARDQSFVDCLGERGAKNRPTDLNAAPRQPSAGGEGIDPLGDVGAVEATAGSLRSRPRCGRRPTRTAAAPSR